MVNKLIQEVGSKLKELGGAHYYQVNDDIYPSVTTILNAFPKGIAFEKWLKQYGMSADDVRDSAAIAGTHVHDALEKLGCGHKVYKKDFTTEEWIKINNAMDFFQSQESFKPLLCEQPLFHLAHRYAGTGDLICELNGDTWLIDYKTGKSAHETYHLQLSAYLKAVNLMIQIGLIKIPGVERINRAGVLVLGSRTKKGWFLQEVTDIEKNFEIFLHTYEVWKFLNPTLPEPKAKLPDELELEPF